MSKPEHPRRRRKAGEQFAFLASAALGAGGCSMGGPMDLAKVGDPILGAAVPAAQPLQPQSAPQNAQQQQGSPAATSSAIPPIPTLPASPTSASLASQTRPLGGLAITDGNSFPQGDGWQRNTGAAPVAPIGSPNNPPVRQPPKVVPVPREDGFSSGQPVPGIQTAGSWSAGAQAAVQSAALSPQQLQQLLESRGVVAQKLFNNADGVHLLCAVPSRSSPEARILTYEVTAPDYATAVQAIVRQIDQQPPN